MTGPILCLIRRDLRLDDNPMLSAAALSGRAVIPVFVLDPHIRSWGAAPIWRLGLGIEVFARALAASGSRLILRRGELATVVSELIAQTGAGAVWWARGLDPASIERDTALKSGLRARGVEARSFPGAVLFDPWTVRTGQGGPYRVYSAFWRAVRGRDPGPPLPPIERLKAPNSWPASEPLAAWDLGRGMQRGAAIVGRHIATGEVSALLRLNRFVEERIDSYGTQRDFPAAGATSGLSQNLTYGEISPRRIWAMALAAHQAGARGAEHFLKELVWREFAWHLMYHTPRIATSAWRPEWDSFPWIDAPGSAEAMAWKQGRTGVDIVDAAMRELYVTGTMHNRARMIAASYLTKNLGLHWSIGRDWFARTLVDWDPASNAMGWQWVAGSGPDAAPYFRIFNPETQARKFDGDHGYRRHWLGRAGGAPTAQSPQDGSGAGAREFFDALPVSWGMSRADPPARLSPEALAASRRAALARYEDWKAIRHGASGDDGPCA